MIYVYDRGLGKAYAATKLSYSSYRIDSLNITRHFKGCFTYYTSMQDAINQINGIRTFRENIFIPSGRSKN